MERMGGNLRFAGPIFNNEAGFRRRLSDSGAALLPVGHEGPHLGRIGTGKAAFAGDQ
jgi:hypothetical protein